MQLVLHLERMVTREGRNVLMRYATIYLFQTLLKVFTVKAFTDFILSAPQNYFHLVYNRKTGGNFATLHSLFCFWLQTLINCLFISKKQHIILIGRKYINMGLYVCS